MDQDGSNSATVAEQAKRFSDFMFSQDVHGIVTNEVADFVEVIRTSFTVEKVAIEDGLEEGLDLLNRNVHPVSGAPTTHFVDCIESTLKEELRNHIVYTSAFQALAQYLLIQEVTDLVAPLFRRYSDFLSAPSADENALGEKSIVEDHIRLFRELRKYLQVLATACNAHRGMISVMDGYRTGSLGFRADYSRAHRILADGLEQWLNDPKAAVMKTAEARWAECDYLTEQALTLAGTIENGDQVTFDRDALDGWDCLDALAELKTMQSALATVPVLNDLLAISDRVGGTDEILKALAPSLSESYSVMETARDGLEDILNEPTFEEGDRLGIERHLQTIERLRRLGGELKRKESEAPEDVISVLALLPSANTSTVMSDTEGQLRHDVDRVLQGLPVLSTASTEKTSEDDAPVLKISADEELADSLSGSWTKLSSDGQWTSEQFDAPEVIM